MPPSPPPPLAPGATIGILGGGQLGRMLATAAAQLGMKTHILCPDEQSPAFDVCTKRTVADYDDEEALKRLAGQADVVTYEFENVPAATAAFIAAHTPLAPGQNALEISQDRLHEKRFLQQAGIAVAPFAPVSCLQDLQEALDMTGMPAVLKTTRFGYDGKGQRIIGNRNEGEKAFEELNAAKGTGSLVLEAFIPFEREISLIIARNASGQMAHYAPSENVHRNHILHTATVPARICGKTRKEAVRTARKIATALDYRGVLAVEFFVSGANGSPGADKREKLLVNEIAPRVHNSGHWTMDACPVDQFSQHIRAICNWPLGPTARLCDAVMTNLIGDEVFRVPGELDPDDIPHVYGKKESRPGRKMGHVNRLIRQNGQGEN